MRYQVIGPIGKGSMGEVFLAEDSELERKVALKFLPVALQSDASALARLRREAKSAASLDHPYICKVYEVGENTKAAELYPQAAKIAKRSPVVFYYGLMTQTVAGIAAAAGEQWAKAVEHFETSLRQAHEFPHKLEQPQLRYWYSKMLTDRNSPGDRDKARQLLGEALEAYENIDFPRHRAMAKELVAQL